MALLRKIRKSRTLDFTCMYADRKKEKNSHELRVFVKLMTPKIQLLVDVNCEIYLTMSYNVSISL